MAVDGMDGRWHGKWVQEEKEAVSKNQIRPECGE